MRMRIGSGMGDAIEDSDKGLRIRMRD